MIQGTLRNENEMIQGATGYFLDGGAGRNDMNVPYRYGYLRIEGWFSALRFCRVHWGSLPFPIFEFRIWR